MIATASDPSTPIYNRVPKVTVDFWLVKLMAVTVGETAADYLNQNLGLGLSMTSWLMSGFLIAALIFSSRKGNMCPGSIGWSWFLSASWAL